MHAQKNVRTLDERLQAMQRELSRADAEWSATREALRNVGDIQIAVAGLPEPTTVPTPVPCSGLRV